MELKNINISLDALMCFLYTFENNSPHFEFKYDDAHFLLVISKLNTENWNSVWFIKQQGNLAKHYTKQFACLNLEPVWTDSCNVWNSRTFKRNIVNHQKIKPRQTGYVSSGVGNVINLNRLAVYGHNAWQKLCLLLRYLHNCSDNQTFIHLYIKM